MSDPCRLMLSAPGATEVAELVGYRSLEAMSRAFRDVGLPSPGTILAQVQYDTMPPLA